MAALTGNQNSTLNSIAVNLLKHHHDIYPPLQHFPYPTNYLRKGYPFIQTHTPTPTYTSIIALVTILTPPSPSQ